MQFSGTQISVMDGWEQASGLQQTGGSSYQGWLEPWSAVVIDFNVGTTMPSLTLLVHVFQCLIFQWVVLAPCLSLLSLLLFW